MGKTILVIAAILLFSTDSSCQEHKWYYKQYGVTDINQLSTGQLNEALRIAKKKATPGIVVLVGGMGCSTAGLLVLLSTIGNEVKGTEVNTGSSLLVAGLVAGGSGAIWASVYTSRSREIKRILRSREAKIGLIKNPVFDISGDFKDSLVPGLLITFNF